MILPCKTYSHFSWDVLDVGVDYKSNIQSNAKYFIHKPILNSSIFTKAAIFIIKKLEYKSFLLKSAKYIDDFDKANDSALILIEKNILK